jgi:hypothetical protein
MVAYLHLGSGLFPFNPDRVLADTPKPPAELIIPKADEVESGPQYEALRTPATPVSAEALTSLLNLIKQVPNNETNRQHKERLQHKVNNAAQTFLAKNALLEDRNQFLTTINNEGKIRRTTKSEILGKARVMSYEDLEKARAERAVKELKKAAKEAKKVASATTEGVEASAGKGRRGRKRNSSEEAGTPEPKAKITRISETQVEEYEIAPESWKAPVARMW